MRPALAFLIPTAAFTVMLPVAAQEEGASEFVGDYDGNAFETASGMRISADGTFQWYVAVGALDMRASGTWDHEGETIIFTSDPKPVAPEFAWRGFARTPDAPFLSIVDSASGNPFDYASITVVCANGQRLSEQAQLGIWSPSEDDDCDVPEKVQLTQSNYEVESRAFDLNGPLKPKPGQTLVFEFRANDLGVADFTGVSGRLDEGVLRIRGPLGSQDLRKIIPRPGAD